MIGAGEQTLGGLAPDAWDRVIGSSFYSSAAFLGLCANHDGALSGAAVAFADGEPAAAVPYAVLTAPPPSLYRWSELLAARGLPAPADGGMLVGPRQGYRTHFDVRAGNDPATCVARLVAELRDLRRDSMADESACVAMYVPTADARALLAAGVTAPPVLLEADASFELPDGGWEAWLASLRSKRRVMVRREVRAFEEAGFEVRRRPLSACIEELPGLAGSTQSRYGHTVPADFWLGLLRLHVAAMGSAAQVALCMRRGDPRPVGFCLYYVWGDTLYLRWAGFDYARQAGAAEYFNLLYYSQVMAAPELGVRRIHAGIKSAGSKALRGAELHPLWLVDLAQDSPLAAERDAVRAHNRCAFEALAADNRTLPALRDLDAWSAFS